MQRRRLTLALDALSLLREAATSADLDVAAAATLAELSGVDAVRIGICESGKPVSAEDVFELRRAARVLELRMPPSQALLKIALEARPDRVVLCGQAREEGAPAGPLEPRDRGVVLAPILRPLADAGIGVIARVAPDLEAVKFVHAEGVTAVEFYTGSIADLPAREQRAGLERVGDAVRLAAKLRLAVGLGGGLGYRTLPRFVEAAPAATRFAVGRAAVARAILVGLDTALRDLTARIG